MDVTNVVSDDLFRVALDRQLNFELHTDGVFIVTLFFVIVAVALLRWRLHPALRRLEIDEAEFGLGDQKIKLRPNMTDIQIAYKIWVELSTRKIGLPVDLENDVLSEVYDSWFGFFSVTREHIKEVPAQRFRRRDTERIISLSIDVLNEGVRPHLTRWQARYRKWYEQELSKDENIKVSPQDIQKNFPQYEELTEDLLMVNSRLIQYRQKMHDLIVG